MIYFIRHGLTESNKKKIYAGWSSEPLSPDGLKAVQNAGGALKECGIKKIYTSPLPRAFQTAEILNKSIQARIIKEENLIEMQLGPWEGMSETEIETRYPEEWKTWNTNPSTLKIPGRETLAQVRHRALKAVKIMTAAKKAAPILAVTHVAVIRVLMIHFNRLDMDDYRGIDIPNATLFELDDELESAGMKRSS